MFQSDRVLSRIKGVTASIKECEKIISTDTVRPLWINKTPENTWSCLQRELVRLKSAYSQIAASNYNAQTE